MGLGEAEADEAVGYNDVEFSDERPADEVDKPKQYKSLPGAIVHGSGNLEYAGDMRWFSELEGLI